MKSVFICVFSILASTCAFAGERYDSETANRILKAIEAFEPRRDKEIQQIIQSYQPPQLGHEAPAAAPKAQRRSTKLDLDPIEQNLRMDFQKLEESFTDNELEKVFPRVREVLLSDGKLDAEKTSAADTLKEIAEWIQSEFAPTPSKKKLAVRKKRAKKSACTEAEMRRQALLAFLMREFEVAQRFNENKQTGRKSAMSRFKNEFFENFTNRFGHSITGTAEEMEAYKKFSTLMDSASTRFENESVVPDAKHGPQEVFNTMGRVLSKAECTPDTMFKGLARAMSRVDWSKESNRKEILNKILFSKTPPLDKEDELLKDLLKRHKMASELFELKSGAYLKEYEIPKMKYEMRNFDRLEMLNELIKSPQLNDLFPKE